MNEFFVHHTTMHHTLSNYNRDLLPKRLNLNVKVFIKRGNENVPKKGKELDQAAPESNALFLMN